MAILPPREKRLPLRRASRSSQLAVSAPERIARVENLEMLAGAVVP